MEKLSNIHPGEILLEEFLKAIKNYLPTDFQKTLESLRPGLQR